MKVHKGGGVEAEQEDIEVIEIPYIQALAMMSRGEIKHAKTIMLLQYLKINQIF